MRFLASAIIKEIERRELLGARKATDRLLHFCYHFFQNCPVQRKTRWYRDCDLSPKTLTQ